MPPSKRQSVHEKEGALSSLAQQQRTRVKKMYDSRSRSFMKKAHELAVLTQSRVHVYISLPGSSKQFKVFLSDLNDENRISTSKISTEQVCGRILGPNDFFTAQEQQMLHENNDMNQVCTSPPSLQANNPDIVDIDAESNVAPAQPQGWSPKKLSHADELLDSYNQAGSGTFYARKPLPVQLDLDFQTCSNERGNATSDMKYYVKLENSYD